MAATKSGGREKAEEPNGKVTATLPPDAIKCLELLAKLKRYGPTKNQVAAYLILREIDDLTRAGVLPAQLPGD